MITTSEFLNAAVTASDLQREIGAQTVRNLAVVYDIFEDSRTRISAIPFRDSDAEPPAFPPGPSITDLTTQIVDRVV